MYGCGGLPRVFPHLSQVSPLPRCNFHSLKACLEACLEACLILAKCLFCSTFHSINGNFHSLEACLEAWTPSKGYPRTHDQHAFKKLPTDTRSAQPWDGTPTIVLHSCTHSCSHSSPVVLHFFIHSGQSYEYGHARPATNSSRHGAWDASPCHFRAQARSATIAAMS